MFRRKRVLLDPLPGANWEVWYEDTFDRENPRSIEAKGAGLMAGLIELWSRHLFGHVQHDGKRGFSAFNLWWIDERRSVHIRGPWEGQVQLRVWIYGEGRRRHRAYAGRKARKLMESIAYTHALLIEGGRNSELIVQAAIAAPTPDDLAAKLQALRGK